MNIHFDNQELLNQLEDATLCKVAIGSHLYGLNTDKSDLDILHIHAKSKNLEKSFLWEHNQLQFKKQNTDLIFTDLYLFLRNLLSGDSTINFEVLHCEEIKNSDLNFLSNNIYEFYNYNIVKSYLGLAKRDLKQCFNESNNFINHKKLSHAFRGIVSAEAILNKEYDNQLTHYQNDFNIIKSLKFEKFNNSQMLIKDLEKRGNNLRDKINKQLEQRQLTRVLNINFMKELDLWLEQFSGTNTYIDKQNKLIMEKDIYYKVLEEGIKY